MDPQKKSTDTLLVKIVTAMETLYEGPASSVSSVNDTGPFDILPLHSNFISLIKNNIILRLPDGSKREFSLSDTGLLRNRANSVQIFLGINPQ